jgi:hypothetical protein
MTSLCTSSEPPTYDGRGGPAVVGRVLATLVLIAFASLICVARAEADEVHVPTGIIGGPGSGNGKLSLGAHSGIAVSIATGDVYASDTGNHRVEEFEPDGTFVRTFAPAGDPGFTPTSIAIDNSAGSDDGDVYVADTSTNSVFKFGADGTQITEWVPKSGGGFEGKLTLTKVERVATGPDGELYVTEPIETLPIGSVYKRYEASGLFVGEFNSLAALDGLAVDPGGNLYAYVGTYFGKLDSSGKLLGERSLGSDGIDLATDPANGDVYVAIETGQKKQIESYASVCPESCGGEEALDEFGQGELSNPRGVAVGPGHIVYVADAGVSKIAVYGTETVEPPTIVGPLEVSDITGNTANASGVINPHAPAGSPSTYKVKFHFECFRLDGEGNRVQLLSNNCGGQVGELPADSSEHTAAGTLAGFSPLTEYEAVLIAANRGGKSETSAAFTTTALPPSVEEVFATGVSMTEATLDAGGLDPKGAETSYYFEYAPAAEGLGGSGTVLTPVGTLPASIAGRQVSVRITGLQPGTTYVFRLVASNVGGDLQGAGEENFDTQALSLLPGGGCPDEVFRVGAGAYLPDCRAYELASPVDKAGLNVEGFPDLLQAAADPSGKEPAVTWYSQAASGFAAGGGDHQEYLSLLSSTSGGSWSTQRLSTPEESAGERVGYLGSSPDLGYALVVAGNEANDEMNLLLIDTATGAVTPVVSLATDSFENFSDDAVAQDGSWVLFESAVPLTTSVAGAAGKTNLYRWEAATGRVSLVGVRPTGSGEKEKTLPGGSFGGAYDWWNETLSGGGASADLYVEAIHAASPDGDQIYLTAGGTGQIYLRRGLTTGAAKTIQVSKPATGAHPAAEHPAAFQEATPDGSFAFFRSSEKLTADATTGPSEEGRDLYRWEEGNEELVDVTPDPGEEAAGGARVEGLLGASSDGSSGYLVALGHLAPGATAGKRNIYRFEEEPSGAFRILYVAPLGEGSAEPQNWSPSSYGQRQLAHYVGKSSRVTSDGGELVFTSSNAQITGYENAGCGPEVHPNEPCSEIFMYSTATGHVVCLSCDPTGSRPSGNATLTDGDINAHLTPEAEPAAQLTRNVSADGDRVFFETPDSLVSGDENGAPDCTYGVHAFSQPQAQPSCMDVYEWEAPGAPGGTCTQMEVNGGCLYLLSTGTSDQASFFVDASSEGNDVFIATLSQLVPVDKDQSYDLYDVHVDGGLASQQVEPDTPCESAGACQGVGASPAGSQSTPGTASFQGPGNLSTQHPASCKKGSVRKHGKCVKKLGHKKKGESKKSKRGKGKKKSPRSAATKGGHK